MARPSKHDGVLYKRDGTQFWWMRYRDKRGERRQEPTGTSDWNEAQRKLRERLQARDDNILEVVRKGEQLFFKEWVDFFLEHYSKPPIRSPKTHVANKRAAKHLTAMFGAVTLAEISAERIEEYLCGRLRQPVQFKTAAGMIQKGPLKPSTVHQEFRVLKRILNMAVRKKLLPGNPCSGVEFPVMLRHLFRPHYMTWSEQQRIEAQAPLYLRHVIRIITETGLRIYKELLPMKKEQVDLENRVVWIPDSKTPNGVAEVPLTELAVAAFRDQIKLSGDGPYLFPSELGRVGHLTTIKTAWRASLRRATIRYFRIYDLRSAYATRLSAGGVADEWVTQLLRQGDAQVFKKYSQMKLQMKREALEKMNRRANESIFGTGRLESGGFGTVLLQSGLKKCFLEGIWNESNGEGAVESRSNSVRARSSAG